MEFFGMGPLEILLVLVVALIAFGPGKLPQVARNMGKVITAFRKATLDLTSEMTKEFNDLDRDEEQASNQRDQQRDQTTKSAEYEADDGPR